jgi:hypothetical protein
MVEGIRVYRVLVRKPEGRNNLGEMILKWIIKK